MLYSQFRFTTEEAHSTRRLNKERKKMKCLGCGKTMVTDRCHRFCQICQRRNRRNQYHLPKIARIGGSLSDS